MGDGQMKSVRPDHDREGSDEPDLPGTRADPRSRLVVAEHEKERLTGPEDEATDEPE